MSVYEVLATVSDRSRRGYVSQLLFRTEAAARGYVPSTPEWPLSMDHILIDADHPHRLLRVEVKQSAQRTKGKVPAYVVELRGSQGVGGAEGAKRGKARLHEYEKSVDIIAIYLPLAKCWYFIPEIHLRERSSVTLNPSDSASRFYEYKDNWDTIKDSMHEVGDSPEESS